MDALSKLIEEMSVATCGVEHLACTPCIVNAKALVALEAFRDWHQGEGGDISVRDAVCLAIQEAQ